jgi:hypothetical protein
VTEKRKLVITPEMLAGIPSRRLDGDWLASDAAGLVALFLGGESGALPRDADPSATADALEALQRAAAVRRAVAQETAAYRGVTERAQEPVLDVPRQGEGEPRHELPLEGYPHVVFSEDPAALRGALEGLEVREVVVRSAFALEALDVSRELHERLHDRRVCLGCWARDRWDDPHPRSPIGGATSGLYVYAHLSADPRAPYFRVASPSTPADLDDVEAAVTALAKAVTFPLRFEEADAISPARFHPLRGA